MVSHFVFKIKTWQALRTSCWVLHVLLRSADRILKLTFSPGIIVMPSRSAPAFQFSQLKFNLCFSPRGFCVYFLSDTFGDNKSQILFAELGYEVFVLKLR